MLRGGPTQEEVLAISLSKLDLRSGDVLADIGCGTGRVSLAASGTASKVYAIDIRPEAVQCTRDAVSLRGIRNVEVIEGSALEALDLLERMDCAFVGGSKDLEKVLAKLVAKGARSIVVNAVLLRTLLTATRCMKELGIFTEVVQVQVARSQELAGDIMFKPIDPVWIIVGKVESC